MKFLQAIFLISIISLSAFAQEKCGVRHNEKALQALYPQLEVNAAQYSLQVANVLSKIDLSKMEKNTRKQYIIPIVFHVLHNYGAERISDQQILEEVAYLNKNYSKTNTTDLNTLVWSWKDSAANCGMEFRLAKKDPNGNCTNGINKIYTQKTFEGDNDSKLNQWPNQYYINIWISNHINGNTTGQPIAYALKPASVAGPNGAFFYDGIISNHRWIGNSGTYSAGGDHYTITHELGHYFGLDHTWGGTNQPLQACGDDGVGDTPETEGHSSCSAADLYDTICKGTNDQTVKNVGVLQNTQNFMEYSGCGAMFTKGQKALMLSNLDDYFYRGSLTDSLAHAYTGVLNTTVTCKPTVDFYSTKRFVCAGTATTLTDYSFNGGSVSRNWNFVNGTPATASTATASVTFSTPGWQSVSLDATNTAGTSNKTENYLYIADPAPVSIVGVGAGKTIANFEGAGTYPKWPIFNYYNNNFTWEHEGLAGYNGGQCLRYQVVDTRAPYQRTSGNSNRDFDDIFSEAYDLTTLGGQINLNFWSAGASFTANPIVWDPSLNNDAGGYKSVVNDSLNIYSSTDCGATWRYVKGFKANDLHNNGYIGVPFLPSNNSQWEARTIPLSATLAASSKVFFRFRYYPSTGGNNFFLDDISISNYGTGITPVLAGNATFAIYPNPSNGKTLNIKLSDNIVAQNQIVITDLTGKVLHTEAAKSIMANNGAVSLNGTLANGIYLVSVVSNGKTIASQKWTIQ